MLANFKVSNFKNFKDIFEVDLSCGNYAFNKDLVHNNLLRCAVIFGQNASGKSNLALAITDLVSHLTDKETGNTDPYLNLSSDKGYATFTYTFIFDGNTLEYTYKKVRATIVLFERVSINGDIVIEYNHIDDRGICNLEDTKNLDVTLGEDARLKLSFIKYVYNNSALKSNSLNTSVFKAFMDYVDKVLLFYSLERNSYRGFKKGTEIISEEIIKRSKLSDFQKFLSNVGIEYDLFEKKIDGVSEIYVDFSKGHREEEKVSNFFTVASTGTRALLVYYYWITVADEASLVLMDEFDAFYHFELSENIVRETLKRIGNNTQVILTTHNTNLMTNTIFRPDCLFIMREKKLSSLQNLTSKELREAHNLQKMYKAGKFDYEQ